MEVQNVCVPVLPCCHCCNDIISPASEYDNTDSAKSENERFTVRVIYPTTAECGHLSLQRYVCGRCFDLLIEIDTNPFIIPSIPSDRWKEIRDSVTPEDIKEPVFK